MADDTCPNACSRCHRCAEEITRLRQENQSLRRQVVELRGGLREICDSAALTSVADCRAIADETMRLNANRYRTVVLSVSEAPPAAESPSDATSPPRTLKSAVRAS